MKLTGNQIKSIILFSTFLLIILVLFNRLTPFIYRSFPNDYGRTRLIGEILCDSSKRPEIVIFGNSRGMSGIDGYKLEKELKHLRNKHVSATETDNGESLIFLHKVKDGSVDKSYGINVAKLAGLPPEVITRASEILIAHEDKSKKQQNLAIQTSLPLEFINNKSSEIEEILKNTNILELTPLKALNLLNELKEKVK